jgi:L-amino acid N-acyltransferase YncA
VQLCGEAAVLTYNFVGEAGGQTDHWHCTQVYRRTPGGWRIIQTHWSVARAAPVKPPPAVRAKRSPNQNIVIRPAELVDLGAITEIYNEAILTTTATFDLEPQSLSERLEWFQAHTQRYRILVAVLDGQVVGWASLSQWSERRAYDDTAETSFYVKAEHRGRGIGRKLKQAIIEEARQQRFHTLIARVAEGSEASLHLNEEFGFVRVGTLKEVGRKFGRLLDVHILQKMLD